MSKTKTRDRARKFQAVIIGAGKIGATFDYPGSVGVLTHAHAFKNHPRIELAGFYDTDHRKARVAVRRWGGCVFDSLERMFVEVNPDIVSVCVPDSAHYTVLCDVLKFLPPLVISEKPLTHRLGLSKKIVQEFSRAHVPLAVNYSRRFDSTVVKFRADLEAGKYGKVLGAFGVYNKGLLHTGSHLLNLAEFLFGEAKKARVLDALADYRSGDPSVGGYLKFQRCPFFHLAIADSRIYEVFELDIFLEKGRARFTDFGRAFSWQGVGRDSQCPEFSVLKKEKAAKTRLGRSLAVLVNNSVNFLAGKEDLFCTANDALRTQAVCEELFKLSKK